MLQTLLYLACQSCSTHACFVWLWALTASSLFNHISDPSLLCMQHYAEHDLRLRRYLPIIQSSLLYPVVLDANRTVLSLPPIINGAHSAVRVLGLAGHTSLQNRHHLQAKGLAWLALMALILFM